VQPPPKPILLVAHMEGATIGVAAVGEDGMVERDITGVVAAIVEEDGMVVVMEEATVTKVDGMAQVFQTVLDGLSLD